MAINPSRPTRRSRPHGRTTHQYKAASTAIGKTIRQTTRATFIQSGSGVGPGSTRSKYGPVIHRSRTNAWNARTAAPSAAHHLTAATGRSAAATGRVVLCAETVVLML